jgi:hypothetical protein
MEYHPTAWWRALVVVLSKLQDEPDNAGLRKDAVIFLDALHRWLKIGGLPPRVEE